MHQTDVDYSLARTQEALEKLLDFKLLYFVTELDLLLSLF